MQLDSIQDSVMFHLSSYSKETFHTDFLYWLSHIDLESTISMFRYLLNDDNFLRDGKYKSYREKENFDFSIWQRNGKKEELAFVLENKVKSVATTEQLDRYTAIIKEKGDCTKAILLTLVCQISGSTSKENYYERDGIKWVVVDYSQYAKSIEKFFLKNEKITCQYHKEVIKDYCRFSNFLSSIGDKIEKNPQLENDEEEKGLRLNDIRQKLLFSIIFNNLNECLRKAGYAVLPFSTISRIRNICKKEARSKKEEEEIGIINEILNDKDKSRPLIFTNTGFTNAMGLVELKFLLKEQPRFSYLIQIQGRDIRLGIEYIKPKNNRRKSDAKVIKDLDTVKNAFNIKTIYAFAPDFFYYKITDQMYTPKVIAEAMTKLIKKEAGIMCYNELYTNNK